MAHCDKKSTIKRLNGIEGQVRGVARMIEEDRYCIDVLHQVQAVKAALSKVEDAILSDHAASCVAEAIASGDAADQRKNSKNLWTFLQEMARAFVKMPHTAAMPARIFKHLSIFLPPIVGS